MSVGKKPCELSVDPLRAFDVDGSVRPDPGPDTEDFIVLCDDAKVDHLDEFAEAKARCLFP